MTSHPSASSPAERWRPLDPVDRPECGYTFDDVTCYESGTHYCLPRADRFVAFCRELLRHTTGPLARQRFILEVWQEFEICRPLFGEVLWSEEWARYVRRYRVAYIVMARKNGKSALAAAIVLYLLVGDDEESAEIYGAALDTKQAAKVYIPVQRMMQLSPILSKRLKENKAARRIYDLKSNSFYEIIAGDAAGELGHNPHGFILDEVLTQRDRDLWDALRTAAGARTQALFLAITTETNDDATFGARLIDEAEKVQEDPTTAPHILAWVRKTPRDADPWDESTWSHANPALGAFKSITEMRTQAKEAQADPEKENSFRQFQLNQRVQQRTRWMPMTRWDATAGMVREEDLVGRACYAGLDLASTTDLAAWVLLFPPEGEDPETGVWDVLWRFWTPEKQVPLLDKYTSGRASVWVREGLLAATEGDWIDYSGDATTGLSVNALRGPSRLAIHPQIAADAQRFVIQLAGYDQAQATATAQFMDTQLGLEIQPITQGFGLSSGLKDLMKLVKSKRLRHGGHPVARWNVDGVEIRRDDQERIKIVRPDRRGSAKRIDGVAALANAIRASVLHEDEVVDVMTSVF